MRLYKARPATVQVHELRMREGFPQRYAVELPNGTVEVLSKAELDAKYEPVIDLQV